MNASPCQRTFVRSCAFVIALFAGAAEATTIIHVKSVATGAGTGVDWANATDIRNALTAAGTVVAGGDDAELWVAAGTYTPTIDPFDRTASFELRSGVAIYGGFSGIETERAARDPEANRTVLSGDIDDDDLPPGDLECDATQIQGGNSYHVVVAHQVDETAVLDGFVITGGDATGEGAAGKGGGIDISESSPTLRNLTICGNAAVQGGGVCSRGASTTSALERVVISRNKAVSGGGIANVQGSTLMLTDCTVADNVAWNGHGGGLYNVDSAATLINVGMIGNAARDVDDGSMGGWGGAIYNAGVGSLGGYLSLTMTSVLVYGNEASSGGAIAMVYSGDAVLTNVTITENSATYHDVFVMYESGGSAITIYIINSIIWANPSGEGSDDDIGRHGLARLSIAHSDTDWTWGGTTNIHEDPLFTSFGRLQAGSPAIDIGVLQPGLPATDLDGNPRIIGDAIDLGAYEYEPPLTLHADMTPVTCHGGADGAIDLTVTGGTGTYEIAWSPGSATTEDLYGLPVGTYSVTVTDTNGCRKMLSVTVTEPPANILALTLAPMGIRDGRDVSIVQLSDRLRIDATTSPALTGTIAYTLKYSGAVRQDLGSTDVVGGVAGTLTPKISPTRSRTGLYVLEAVFTSASGCVTVMSQDVIVDPEDATITPHPSNRMAFTAAEAEAGFTLEFTIRETYPEPSGNPPGVEPGNINGAFLHVYLTPLSGSQYVPGDCTPGVEVAPDAYVERSFTCSFKGLPVDTYELEAGIGITFRGTWFDALTVYDPSAGFLTGGGTFVYPSSEDRVNFGLVYRFTGKDKETPRGNLLVIRHMENGDTCRAKSNGIGAPAISGNTASFSGKGSYLCMKPDGTTYAEAGNLAFTGWVEDRESRAEPDRIWIRIPETALAMVKPIAPNAAPLRGGNIQVPQKSVK
jgi:hypothetical protein